MIQPINNLPANMVGFRAIGDVTKDDFTNVIIPQVNKLVEKTGKLNYLLVLEDSPKEWTAGAWLQDAMMGIKNLTTWNRAAMVTDSEGIKKFTDAFSLVVPGEFRGFDLSQLDEAINWVAGEVHEHIEH